MKKLKEENFMSFMDFMVIFRFFAPLHENLLFRPIPVL